MALLGLGLGGPASCPAGTGEPAPKPQDSGPRVRALLYLGAAEPAIPAEAYRRAQLDLLRSRPVLQAALASPAVATLASVRRQKDPVAWLGQQLRTELLAPEVLRLSVHGAPAAEQATLVNAVAAAYVKAAVQGEQGQRRPHLDEQKKLREKYTRLLQDKRRRLRELAEAAGAGDPKALIVKKQLLLLQLAALRAELLRVQIELRKARLEMEDLKKPAPAPLVPEFEIERALNGDAKLAELLTRAAKVEADLAEFRKRFTRPEREPSYQRALVRLEAAKKAVADRLRELRPVAVSQYREWLRAERRQALGRLGEEIRGRERLEKVLGKEVGEQVKVLNGLMKRAVEMEGLRDEIARAEEAVRLIAAGGVRVLEAASAPR
jgi:hypothetical protein